MDHLEGKADTPAAVSSDRFEILSELGKGGMGVVYEALDREQGLRVALKAIQGAGEPKRILRLKNEFRALRDLEHPNLVRLGELFEDRGRWYFTMELVEGIDFLRYVQGASFGPPSLRSSSSEEKSTRAPSTAATGGSTLPTADGPPGDPLASSWCVPVSGAGRASPCALDEERLRRALRELATGLIALHRAGKVHRDIKPSNILVEAAGRVVLLDFGVVADLAAPTAERSERVGTLAYMAPEQIRGQPVGPAADWYAVGVLLFQAMSGRLPVEGPGCVVRMLRCELPAPSPRRFSPAVPDDLERLCLGFLERDPAARPGEAEIIRALGVDTEWLAASSHLEPTTRLFVGRQKEIAVLSRAYQAHRQSRPVAVLLEGQSGVGKTETVREFLASVRRLDRGALILAGKCHEKELVSYNAFDGIIDGLTQFLRSRSPERLLDFLPLDPVPMLRVFPVLRAIPALRGIATAAERPTESGARRQAFVALRQTLTRIAEKRQLVLFADDVHWADPDSLALMEELMRAAEPSRLFMLATCRPTEDRRAHQALEAAGCDLHTIPLGPLCADDARALSLRLLEEHGLAGEPALELILKDSGGHPMFLDSLVRHVARTGTLAGARTSLDEAVWARIGELGEASRELLSWVVIAGSPVSHRILSEAIGMSPEVYARETNALGLARLIRVTGARREDTIEVYHDRVRESVAPRLPAERARELHRQLGRILERELAPPEVLAEHFIEAGDRAKGTHFALLAATKAASALAFDRASRFYRLVLKNADLDPAEARRLRTLLGQTLASAGRALESAREFVEAAATGAVEPAESLELTRKACEQLLMGGHLEEGMKVTRDVLAAVSLRLPAGPLEAVLRTLWHQLRLTLRGLGWKRTEEAALPREALHKLDVCWSVSAGLSMVDPLKAAVFSSQLPRLCLDLGEPFRICRALCAMAYSESAFGNLARAERLLAATERAAAENGTDLARFYAALGWTANRFMGRADYRASLSAAKQGLALWKKSGKQRGWEADVLEQFACWSLQVMGEIPELKRRVQNKIQEALDTGNRYGEVVFRVCFPHVQFADDEPDAALREMTDAMRTWVPASHLFGPPNYWAAKTLALYLTYTRQEGELADALEREWRRLDRALLGRVGIIRMEAEQMRALVAASRAQLARARGDQAACCRFVAELKARSARIRRTPFAISEALSLLIEAAVMTLERDRARLVSALETLKVYSEETSMKLGAAAILRRLGQVHGGEQGAVLIAESDARFRQMGVANPEAFSRLSVPVGWSEDG